MIDDESERLRARISEAASKCAILRASGTQEQYMEAFDLVEALEFQLEKKLLGDRRER